VTITEMIVAAAETAMQAGRGHMHWDEKGTHGANCPLCLEWAAARERWNAFKKRHLPSG